MKNGRWLAVLGLLAAVAAGPAAAQDDRGLYLGASAGGSMFDHSCDLLTIPCDENDVGWRGFAGYRFNRHLSAELGFANLGEVKAEGTLLGAPASRTKELKNVFDISGLLSFGITGRLDGFVRLGLYHARVTVDDVVTATGFTEHTANTNHGWTVGAGLQYNLGFLGVRVEWQRYDDVGPNGSLQDNVDLVSAGLLLRF